MIALLDPPNQFQMASLLQPTLSMLNMKLLVITALCPRLYDVNAKVTKCLKKHLMLMQGKNNSTTLFSRDLMA